jgi:glycerol kinase
MQFQADLLGIPVVRPQVIETTALGAAWLAALGLGIAGGTDALESQWQIERRFEPALSRDEAFTRMAQWERAVGQLVSG